jgi:hypothetical protein
MVTERFQNDKDWFGVDITYKLLKSNSKIQIQICIVLPLIQENYDKQINKQENLNNMIFWRKIVIFHTKYPNNFRASLRSAQIF